jgi:hypothetical protein
MKVKLPVVGGIVLCHALQVPHQLEHRPSGHASAGTPSDSPPKHHTTVRLMKVKLPVVGGIVLCHALQIPHQLEHCGIAHLNTIQL